MELQENCDRDVKEENQVKKNKVQSTKARHNDGPTCSSVEGPVMGLEQRRRVVLSESVSTR